MRTTFLVLLLSIGLGSLSSGCASTPVSSSPPPLLLISMDGFRWDYCARHPEETPHLRRLISGGSSARGLIPPFPSHTFVSHYTIATGLYPAHHGIINNVFFDPNLSEFFRYKTPAASHDPRWWRGEPIWITAVRQGRQSACYFWPGSEVTLNGRRATFSKPYNYSVPFEQRANELFAWLHLPEDERPAIITFYFEETNRAGHAFGPESAEVTAAISLIDRQIGVILDRAESEQIKLNVVIVSDHGFVATDGRTKTAMLDDFVDFDAVQVDFDGPIAGLRPLHGDANELLDRLKALPPQYKVYRASELPSRWHMIDNDRIPPVWIVPEPGWRIQRRSTFNAVKDYLLKGDHGYDPAIQDMQGVLIAHGPSFRSGTIVDPLEAIHVYNLLCAAAGLKPAPNDGDDRLVRAMLKR